VVVLSVSESEEDILQCYNRQANCYITKPIHLEQFIKTIRAIEDFWLNIVMLPE
jgi:DNA-binding NarL/FixJ family response regulator